MKQLLYLEIGGFLNMIVQGHKPANLSQQAQELLDKIGDAMAEEYPESVEAKDTARA